MSPHYPLSIALYRSKIETIATAKEEKNIEINYENTTSFMCDTNKPKTFFKYMK